MHLQVVSEPTEYTRMVVSREPVANNKFPLLLGWPEKQDAVMCAACPENVSPAEESDSGW